MSRPPADVVRTFFTSMRARDWDGAAACLAADVRIWWPSPDERFADGVELWGTQGAEAPPGWRERFTASAPSGR